MTDILLHPGFHKTGTSSIQHFLWANRGTLDASMASIMLRHLKQVVRMTCRFSRHRNPIDLLDFVAGMDAALADAAPRLDQNLLVSCEGLLGHLPGWPGIDDYAAAPTLITYLVGYFQDRYPHARLRIVLTTRDADEWLFSTYRHHLRGRRLTLSPEEFAARFAPAADLTAMAAVLAEAAGNVPVFTLSLSDMRAYPLGPGGAFCDLMQVPADVRADLEPVGIGNTGPELALWQQFLTLNRSTLNDRAVQVEKARLAQAADLGGWRRA